MHPHDFLVNLSTEFLLLRCILQDQLKPLLISREIGYSQKIESLCWYRRKKLGITAPMERFLKDVERRAYRIAYIACGNRDDALDIIQDTMMKLVKKYSERTEQEWPPLFHRILQSTIKDHYRRVAVRNRWRKLIGNNKECCELEQMAMSHDPGPLQHNSNNQAVSALDTALYHLPLRQQQAFLLRAWEGLSVKETAQAMTCAEGSVKTHYSRAIHSLRETLGEHSI